METAVERKPAQAIWKLLRDKAFASLRDDLSAKASECALSLPQAKLVRELSRPQSQRALARRLQYDPSNITALADSLEEKGLLERKSDTSDRRFKMLALTAEGERARRSLEELLSRPPDFVGRLSAAEQQQLLALLNKIFS